MTTTKVTPAETLLNKIIDRTSAYNSSFKHENGATILRLQHKDSGEPGAIFFRKRTYHKSINITPNTKITAER
jgi:hypothetical protein